MYTYEHTFTPGAFPEGRSSRLAWVLKKRRSGLATIFAGDQPFACVQAQAGGGWTVCSLGTTIKGGCTIKSQDLSHTQKHKKNYIPGIYYRFFTQAYMVLITRFLRNGRGATHITHLSLQWVPRFKST